MTNLRKLSPRERRRDDTTWVRDLKTGDVIECFHGSSRCEHDLQVHLGCPYYEIAFHTIQDGPCEGVEYITADGVPVAWIDWPPHSFLTDEIDEALFPAREAAQ